MKRENEACLPRLENGHFIDDKRAVSCLRLKHEIEHQCLLLDSFHDDKMRGGRHSGLLRDDANDSEAKGKGVFFFSCLFKKQLSSS